MTILRRVVGAEFDGTCVTYVFGRTEIPLLSASYGDSLTVGKVSDLGSQQIDAMTPGKYETEQGTIKMRRSVFSVDLMQHVPQEGMGNVSMSAIILLVHPDLGSDSDELVCCRIIGPKATHEPGEKPEEIELKIEYRQVLWTDKRIAINRRKPGFVPTSPIGFSL